METRLKVLRYRRVRFAALNDNMQKLVTRAAKKLNTDEKRTLDKGGKRYQAISIDYDSPNSGVFLNISTCAIGERAAIVQQRTKSEHVGLKTTNAPQTTEFMSGNVHALIYKNDVFYCLSSIHEGALLVFLEEFLSAANVPYSQFTLSRVANRKILQQITQDGVKSIDLNTSMYMAAFDKMYTGSNSKVRQAISSAASTVGLVTSPNSSHANDLENISVGISLTAKGRVKDFDYRTDELKKLSDELIKDMESDFKITTKNGTEIKSEKISLSKKVKIEKFATTVVEEEAWRELSDYREELVHDELI